jgi:putative ABC transport system substrate-binding protein
MGIVAIVVAFALCGAVAEAQQQLKTPEIVSAGGHFGAAPSREWVASEFRPLHYVDDRDGVFKIRLAQSKSDRRNGPADELVRMNVDVLIASSTPEALALKNATRTIPIVFIVSTDPVADGLVDSLARPGGNVTGVTTIVTALAGKRLELLKETVPKLARVAVLWDSQDPSSAQNWKESQFAARELGLQLHSMQVSIIDKLDGAFKEAIKAQSAALAVTPSPLVNAYAKYITALATKYRLPTIFDRGEFVANGGLMSYGPDPAEPYRRAAAMVDKILKGAKPADIPVEQPTKFELVINLKTAKQIGLTIPPALLSRAEKVIR